MEVSPEAVEHISKLARLQLKSEEIQTFSAQLTAVLEHFKEISKIETQGVLPLVTPTDIALYLREDGAEKHGAAEQMLANAPEKSGALFKVPPVVG